MVLPARNHGTRKGISFTELYDRLTAERPTRLDAVVNTRDHVAMTLVERPGTATGLDAGMLFMTPEIAGLDGAVAHLTDHMHAQVAARAGIDKRYYDRMRASQPELLIRNVDTWWHSEPESRMVRTVQPARVTDGVLTVGGLTGRAWLSDRYKTLDNFDFITTVLEEASNHGANILDCHLDDERVYLKLVSPRLQAEVKQGDVLEAGVIVKNSEVGDGKVLVQPYIHRLVCSNGLVRKEQFGQVHLGGQNEAGILQQDTLEQEAKSVWLQVRDWVRAVFTGHFLEAAVAEFRAAEGVQVPVAAKVAVANVVRAYGLTGADGEGILERYLRNDQDTMFGLVNAVTQYAHEGTTAFRRQVELEVYGGQLLATPPQRFLHMVQAPITDEQVAKAVSAV